jgi:hypothetical protein
LGAIIVSGLKSRENHSNFRRRRSQRFAAGNRVQSENYEQRQNSPFAPETGSSKLTSAPNQWLNLNRCVAGQMAEVFQVTILMSGAKFLNV